MHGCQQHDRHRRQRCTIKTLRHIHTNAHTLRLRKRMPIRQLLPPQQFFHLLLRQRPITRLLLHQPKLTSRQKDVSRKRRLTKCTRARELVKRAKRPRPKPHLSHQAITSRYLLHHIQRPIYRLSKLPTYLPTRPRATLKRNKDLKDQYEDRLPPRPPTL